MNRLKKIICQGLTLGLFGGILFTSNNAVKADVSTGVSDTVPAHITNIGNLFNVPDGSNSEVPGSDGITTITTDGNNLTGAIWAKEANRLDLTKDFSASMWLNFDNKGVDAGDGMAFVMQAGGADVTLPQNTNDKKKDFGGQRLGVWALPKINVALSEAKNTDSAIQKSFAVEFDTHQNLNWDYTKINQNTVGFTTNPIENDHIADGFPNQSSSYEYPYSFNPFKNYVSMLKHNNLQDLGSSSYLSDGKWHQFTVSWSASTKVLTYQFERKPAKTVKIDTDTIFGKGITSVDWGFTGSTGGSTEVNKVVFDAISNIPTTAQSYKIYHKNTDGTQGAEVTQANPAVAGEPLIGKITASVDGSSKVPWSNVAVRQRYTTGDTTQGAFYSDGLLIDGKDVSTFMTPSIALDGTALTPIQASADNLFADHNTLTNFGTGINIGNVNPGTTKEIQFNLNALGPTQLGTSTSGELTNLGREQILNLDGSTARDETSSFIYITTKPVITLADPYEKAADTGEATGTDTPTSQAKPLVIDKDKLDASGTLSIGGKWSQSILADSQAKGTLHYKLDNNPEVTVAQNNTGGALTGLNLSGLSMNEPHEITITMTNAGYNQTSVKKHFWFKIKGGSVSFSNVPSTVAFKPVTVGTTTTAGRADGVWAPEITDDRGQGSNWSLYANATDMKRDGDDKVLDGQLIYKNGDVINNLMSDPILVDSKTTTTDSEVTKVDDDWKTSDNSAKGVLLKVNAGAYKGEYSGTINWTLSNAAPAGS